MARHGERNVPRDHRLDQLRRLQAVVLRGGCNRVGAEQRVDATCGDNVCLQAQRIGLQRDGERNLALGADLLEVIAPAARAAKQYERQ